SPVMKTMGVKVIDRLFIVRYGASPLSDREWAAYLALVDQQGVERTAHLVVTDGGGPTAGQRHALNALLAGRVGPVAGVSSSARVRGTVAAISWFNGRIRAFPSSGLREALIYLEVPVSRRGIVEEALRELAQELGERDDRGHEGAR